VQAVFDSRISEDISSCIHIREMKSVETEEVKMTGW